MKKHNQKGFTLIELLIVLTIIFVVVIIVGLLIAGAVWWIRAERHKAQLNPQSAVIRIIATPPHFIKTLARNSA